MKTIGKIAALAMTVGMAFVLTACGGGASSSAASSSAAASGSASAAASSAAASSAAASTSSAAASSESASASTESASASASAASASAGKADTYDNEYFGISFSLPEGWSFIDDQSASISGTESGSKAAMVAASANQESTVTVGVEEANSANAGQTDQAHLDAVVQQLTESSTSNANTSIVTDSATMSFDGIDKTLPASISTITSGGSSKCVGIAVMEKEGDFLDIVVIGQSEDEVLGLFKQFKAIME